MILVSVDEINDPYKESSLYLKKIDALEKDIAKNGLKRPIILVKEEGKNGYSVYDGNHRLKALKRLGWKQIPSEIKNVECQPHPFPR